MISVVKESDEIAKGHIQEKERQGSSEIEGTEQV